MRQRGFVFQTEIDFRRAVWEKNVHLVLRHNQEASAGKHSFTLGLNHLADMVGCCCWEDRMSKLSKSRYWSVIVQSFISNIKTASRLMDRIALNYLKLSVVWSDHRKNIWVLNKAVATERRGRNNCRIGALGLALPWILCKVEVRSTTE